MKKLVLKNFAKFTRKNQRKICEIFKNTYFEEYLGTTAFLKVKEPYMTSTRKWEREVLKFVTCLWILLFLNNRSIVDFCEWWGGSQKMVIFVDVINGSPLNIVMIYRNRNNNITENQKEKKTCFNTHFQYSTGLKYGMWDPGPGIGTLGLGTWDPRTCDLDSRDPRNGTLELWD